MQIALGRDEESEAQPGMFKISQLIDGPCGLLFTNEKVKIVKECVHRPSLNRI